ncbi:MAG: hypothetical protein KAI43_07275 [Candidatus Aureabacteria bacterium]|nr:hypothetical protein [Candidatus Auribacterota bacterium]
MKKVNTAELEAGMKIAQKVENANGMVLLPEGIVLTEAHIGRLKKWGIESIFVEGEGEDGGGGGVVPSMELSEEFIKNLDHKFEKVKDDPIMQGIYEAVKNVASQQSETET